LKCCIVKVKHIRSKENNHENEKLGIGEVESPSSTFGVLDYRDELHPDNEVNELFHGHLHAPEINGFIIKNVLFFQVQST